MSDKQHYHGHRERLRNRFQEHGISSFQEYEIVELLLTYLIPQKDVKLLAKNLIKEFGSMKNLIETSPEKLSQIEGIKERSALFFSLLRSIIEVYQKQKIEEKPAITSPNDVYHYLQTCLGSKDKEHFLVLFLNSQNQIVGNEILHEGTINQSTVYPRTIIERIIHHQATAIIIAHNHPSGSLQPSSEDRSLTQLLQKALSPLDVVIHDHIIITRNGCISFKELGII